MQTRVISFAQCDLLKQIDRSDNVRAAWQITEGGIRSLDFTYLDILGYGERIDACIDTLRSVVAQGGVVYGAFENDGIVGIASVLANPENNKGYSILVSIDVSSGSRRKGIGRALLNACVSYSQALDCTTMLIAANPYESTVKFLKSYGFLYSERNNVKLKIPKKLISPIFDFPKPFGNNVEQPIFMELPLNEFQDEGFFYNRVSLDEITAHNYYGAMRLSITDRQSFTFGNNPVYFMASYKFEFGEDHKLLVACFDTFPVGFMGYGVSGDEKCVFIEPMMVDSSFQRKRIASKMLELFENKIRSANRYEAMTIGNRTDNTAAANTYEKAGFKVIKQEDLSSYRRKDLDL